MYLSTDYQLRSGQTPSLGEAATNRVLVDQTHSYLNEVKRVKSKLLQSLLALEDLETKLSSIRLRQLTYIVPIRRLPVELLLLIFECACEEYGLNITSCTPVKISRTCVLWRGTALQSHRRKT